MQRVEIREWLWFQGIPPNLAENADVDGAHELLAEDVETVG
jgi:hypothetical protein